MKKLLLLLAWFSISITGLDAQVSARPTNFTTSTSRSEFISYLKDTTISLALQQPLNKIVESQWKGAFWAMELINFQHDSVSQKLRYLLTHYSQYSDGFKRSLLEVVYALYPTSFQTLIATIAYREQDSKRFAMCMAYLKRISTNNQQRVALQNTIIKQFPNWKEDPILFSLYHDIQPAVQSLPSFKDLMAFYKGKKMIYSFQRPNRNYAGIAIIQNEEGNLVRDENGKIRFFEQFARSSSNLPWYITNGNTPQGIFVLTDTATSDNSFIGPTPNFQTQLPFESSVKTFTHEADSGKWSYDIYNSLLPESWRNYAPIQHAYFAGKAGRTEIIAHGTCIDPSYYRDQIYYPYTPSMGCLTGKEIWNPDGTIAYSAQLAMVNAWLQTPGTKGYLIVIHLEDKNETVQLAEIEKLLNE